jgi:tetratricopeptide (TPR) repeat protein
MQGRPLVQWMLAGAGIILLSSGPPLRAQDPAPESSSKPADTPTPKKPDKKQKSDTATQNAADQPSWDPLRAEKDLEVGQYYMRKGDVDAAIDRFQDATTAKPGYAVPFRFLGEAQEKKGLKKQAIASYSRYLDLYPHAEDGDKIRKKIDKLRNEVERKKK